MSIDERALSNSDEDPDDVMLTYEPLAPLEVVHPMEDLLSDPGARLTSVKVTLMGPDAMQYNKREIPAFLDVPAPKFCRIRFSRCSSASVSTRIPRQTHYELSSLSNLTTPPWSEPKKMKPISVKTKIQEETLMQAIGDYERQIQSLFRNGEWQVAQMSLERYVRQQRTSKGPNHPLTLRALGLLATAYAGQDKWPESIAIHEEIVESRLGMDLNHPETVKSMVNLGAIYMAQGKVTQGLELLFHADETTQRIKYPPNDEEYRRVLSHLRHLLSTGAD
ncbi:hypothetical protein PIIN_03696 [Serendipita indica DSM 11827]|uniref:Kinesin light chain n=1 Tax=Serendipita indica (strain DSM 11827) TaxID=1109443 RepID=G4TEK6_SERID|nr:hypothetical protein PIIN_03696 [Serendipita indica DSM 11827]